MYIKTANNKQSLITENLSKRIKSLQFILIFLVVTVHTLVWFHIVIKTPEPVYVEKIRILFSDIIAKAAVPMFFLISSFFLYSKEENFVAVLKKKSRTLLLPYILWQFLYLSWTFIVQNNPVRESLATQDIRLLNFNVLDWLQAFLGNFSDKSDLNRLPYNYSLWFLRDLFILNLFFIPIKKMIDKFPLTVLMITILLWISDIQLWVIAPRALLFFALGYYIIKYNITEKSVDKIRFRDVGIVYIITTLLVLFFKKELVAIEKINIITGCLFFIKASFYFIKNGKLYNSLVWLGKFVFIIFAFHALILQYVIKIMNILMPMEGGFLLLKYFSAVILTILFCIMSGIILDKLTPKIYRLLTGGRSKKQNIPTPHTSVYTPSLSSVRISSHKGGSDS